MESGTAFDDPIILPLYNVTKLELYRRQPYTALGQTNPHIAQLYRDA